jgi:hypothetical protein
MQLTRRELLAGAGLGMFGIGGLALGGDRPRFSAYTYAADGDVDDRRVRIAWYERYNGAVRETQAGSTDGDVDVDAVLDPDSDPASVEEATYVTDVTGPVLTVGNAMPGDTGALVVGLSVVVDGDFVAEPLDIWVQARQTADTEGRLNEPEQTAGDTSPDDGELDEEVVVELWRDGAPFGSCNGRTDFTEQLESPIVARSSLADAFGSDGVGPGRRVFRSLDPGQTRCVALSWEFSHASATNRSQGDGAAFDLVFVGTPVGADNPFDAEVTA